MRPVTRTSSRCAVRIHSGNGFPTMSSEDHAVIHLPPRADNMSTILVDHPINHALLIALLFFPKSQKLYEQGFSSRLICKCLEYNFTTFIFEIVPPKNSSEKSQNVIELDCNVRNNERVILVISECSSCQLGVLPKSKVVLRPLFFVYNMKFFQPFSGEPVSNGKIVFPFRNIVKYFSVV